MFGVCFCFFRRYSKKRLIYIYNVYSVIQSFICVPPDLILFVCVCVCVLQFLPCKKLVWLFFVVVFTTQTGLCWVLVFITYTRTELVFVLVLPHSAGVFMYLCTEVISTEAQAETECQELWEREGDCTQCWVITTTRDSALAYMP